MIQLNLLPDLKMEYIKAQRTKHMLSMVSIIASAAALGLLLFSFFIVYVVQRTAIRWQDDKISAATKTLNNTQNLNKLLTVQNQLRALTSLHENKPVVSRLFTQVSSVTPDKISLNKVALDFSTNKVSLGGNAPSYDAVRVYADTLKTTTFKLDDVGVGRPAFTGVVLTSFAKDDAGVSFAIDTTFAPELFAHNNDIKLQVVKGPKTNQDRLFNSEGVR